MLYALLSSGPILAAQGGPTTPDRRAVPTFASGIDMVTVYATVRDSRGRIVPGLGISDFRLIDRGFGKPIAHVLPSDAPLRVAVLVDMSGSMAVGRNIDRARHVVESIIGSLHHGHDEAALFSFDRAVREIVPFTRDLNRFGAVDFSGRPYGQTSLYDAIADTATLIGGDTERHRALLVVTDGIDTASRRTAAEVSGVANATSVPVHLLALGGILARHTTIESSPDLASRAATVADLARWTGGGLHAAGTDGDLQAALRLLIPGLRHQYILTFKPGVLRGWHPIEIRMADNRHTVRARHGYVAGRARLSR